MATTVFTPVIAYIAAIQGGVANGPSGNVTAILTNLAWEVQVPVKVQFGSQVSNDPTVSVYPSSDNGTTFDTQPMAAYSIANNASSSNTASLRLPTGIYIIRIQTSGGNTVSVAIFTAQQITSLIGV